MEVYHAYIREDIPETVEEETSRNSTDPDWEIIEPQMISTESPAPVCVVLYSNWNYFSRLHVFFLLKRKKPWDLNVTF